MATDTGPLDAGLFGQAHDTPSGAENDAFHDTHSTTSNMGDRDEADTCRICRGEGTVDEPLFYPCKCSGSIKYVHQECLMEWLSHTQKKHCELCKTSFRFTKLYHPGMPSRIPTAVFLRRAALHVLNMFLTWCRGVLVASVWLILLPWCMRVVWRSLFWVGDGGWAPGNFAGLPEATDRNRAIMSDPDNLEAIRSTLEAAKANGTAHNLTLSKLLMSSLPPTAQQQVFTANEPLLWTILKRMYLGWQPPASSLAPAMSNGTELNSTTDALGFRSPSLLSDISWFHWFNSQTANRFLIDIFEGQIITMSVVLAFILIFLIREWVVQQQPVINMVALGGDGAVPQDQVVAQVPDERVAHMPEEQERNAEHDEDDETNNQINTGDSSDPDPTTVAGALELGARRPNGFLRRQRELANHLRLRNPDLSPLLREVLESGVASDEDDLSALEGMSVEQLNMIGTIFDQSLIDAYAMLVAEEEGSSPTEASFPSTSAILKKQRREPTELFEDNDSESSQRPEMPARDKSFIANHIRRSLEEGSSWSFDNVPVASDDASGDTVPDNWDGEDLEASGNHRLDATQSDNEPGSEGSSGSWQQVADVNVGDDSDQALEGRRPQDKGKGRANEDPPKNNDNAQENDLSAEDRANTEDGIHMGLTMDVEVEAEASTPEPSMDRDNTPTPNETNAATDARPPPVEAQEASVLDIIMDWIYGPADPAALPQAEPANDEHVVRNIEDEAPFVPFANNEQLEPADVPVIQDPEVAAAAARAGIDVNEQDAIDDAEDLEGILELIGMQGPLIGLFQNAVFSAVLISATLACAVWLPYLWGKVVILFIGSPVALFIKLPLQIVATVTDLLVDVTLVAAGGFAYWTSQFLLAIVKLSTKGEPGYLEDTLRRLIVPTQSIVKNAVIRITQALLNSSLSTSPGYFKLSINSHAALRTLQNSTSFAVNQTNTVFGAMLQEAQNESTFKLLWRGLNFVISSVGHLIQQSKSLITWIWTSKSYRITLDMDLGADEAVTSALDYWTANDRLIAVLAGYTFFALAGAIYLRRGTPFSTSQQGQRIERIISDILQQAGGVLKVILIISIEMLAFPLYCGLLLDLAMLPLFRDATIYSRWRFACESPWTAGFVHWFIGTCYMFHFALFVAMCRKIMRKGVLYFIRDPDDPTFHPVRDVLERSVTTQLRKIAFSALVYGALVIVCLGGVVWTLSRVTYGVLPIHWTTEAPSLEFPLDLLFYNFLTPVIIKAYKPGEGLHTVCTWWFKKCASALRLSHFLFNERIDSEEGHHINTTWFGWVIGRKGEVNTPQKTKGEGGSPNENGSVDTYFVPDGRYVRAPASDQCRVPKGQAVFVDVDKDNVRKDGNTDGGVHNSDLVQMVYIPPWFRLRIACFVITIWIFMGISGVSVTIVPLMFGRYLFSLCLPPTVEMNDIHAFSLGVYTLGSVAYSGYQAYKLAASLNRPDVSPLSQLRSFAATASQFSLTVLRFSYVWASLIFAIPLLCAVLIELYFLMPLHAWMGPSDPHVIHLIQDWTLGFLYSRLAARLLFANRNTRPAQAFNQVIEGGYLHPNARIATRCFVLPVLALFAIAIAVPASVAWISTHLVYHGASEAIKSQIWRYSFPAVGLAIAFMFAGRVVARIVTRWRLVVRDEVYLIGERLHNFGEKRAPQARLDAGNQTSGPSGAGAQTPPVAVAEGN